MPLIKWTVGVRISVDEKVESTSRVMRSFPDLSVGRILPRNSDFRADDARRASDQEAPARAEWIVTASYPPTVMFARVAGSGRNCDYAGIGDQAWDAGKIGRPIMTFPAARRIEIGRATIVLGLDEASHHSAFACQIANSRGPNASYRTGSVFLGRSDAV